MPTLYMYIRRHFFQIIDNNCVVIAIGKFQNLSIYNLMSTKILVSNYSSKIGYFLNCYRTSGSSRSCILKVVSFLVALKFYFPKTFLYKIIFILFLKLIVNVWVFFSVLILKFNVRMCTCNGLGFTSTTTNTALVGYLFSSFYSILDFNLEVPGSIPRWCVAFISTFPLFPTIYN